MIEMRPQSRLLPLTSAAKVIGVSQQTLSQYLKANKLTVQQAGGVYLVDPEVARRELEEDGFFERREARKARWQK